MRLAIIIVSYNTRILLNSCLHSVFASADLTKDRLQVEVVVVDNDSHDGSAAMVRDKFPQVRLCALTENRGFTGGNNYALQLLGFGGNQGTLPAPDFVLLLNPDTEVIGDALWQMVNVLQSMPQAGACGAALQYGDGRFQHGAFAFPSLAQAALDFFPLTGVRGSHRLHNSRLNGRYPQTQWQGTTPFPVDFVLGAALMVRSAAIQQIGLLDEGYFMYCEEIDWCMRLYDAGWQVLSVPTAHVIHHEGQSSRQVRWKSYERLWRSRLRLYDKHRGRYSALQRWALRRLVWLGINARKRQALRHLASSNRDERIVREELETYQAILTWLRG